MINMLRTHGAVSVRIHFFYNLYDNIFKFPAVRHEIVLFQGVEMFQYKNFKAYKMTEY